MVTPTNMANTFAGKALDNKPSGCANGSAFIEMDTGKVYFYDAEGQSWIEFGGSADSDNADDS